MISLYLFNLFIISWQGDLAHPFTDKLLQIILINAANTVISHKTFTQLLSLTLILRKISGHLNGKHYSQVPVLANKKLFASTHTVK